MQVSGSDALPQADLWHVLEQLAGMKEEALRLILRPHEESAISWKRDRETIDLRNKLDAALGALTRFEVDTQVGPSESADSRTLEIQKTPFDSFPAKESLLKLFRSEAFLHYCDTYLYFGIRFLAHRFFPPNDAAHERLTERWFPETTWRPFALMTPPALKNVKPAITANFFSMLRADPSVEEPAVLHPAAEETAALLFLDGFLDNPLDFELWLRGLLPGADGNQLERLQTISSGLRSWIARRVEFYIQLADRRPAISAEGSQADDREFQEGIIGKTIADELGAAFFSSVVLDKSAYAQGRTRSLKGFHRPSGGWRMNHPAAARCGLADVYWIARLLRATVSSAGMVSYQGTSWLHLLRFQADLNGDANTAEEIGQSEEILRSVFDYVCELVQNAIAVTGKCVGDILTPEPAPENNVSKAWQYVFDRELAEIAEQKEMRNYRYRREGHPPDDDGGSAAGGSEPLSGGHPPLDDGWSERVKRGRTPSNLVGIALSGGGIRSATFNLGVLQGLQELDLLRHVDYLSTVSGGGFIGSWLVANVRRSVHWLGRVTDWRASIAHLRSYSSYLAPRTGVLSADTWTMVATWLRNTFFIQLTGLAWLFVLLLSTLALKPAFIKLPVWQFPGMPLYKYILYFTGFLVAVTILYQLLKLTADNEESPGDGNPIHRMRVKILTKLLDWQLTQRGEFLQLPRLVRKFRAGNSLWVRRFCIYPACVAAFCVSSLFWHDATTQSSQWVRLDSLIGFGSIVRSAWGPWRAILLFSLLALIFIALFSMRKPRRVYAFWIGPLCTAVLYLCLCAIFYFDLMLARMERSETAWTAYVITPALVLFAYALSVVLLIGFCGRVSSEAFREWWTRVGAWLMAYPLAWIALTGIAVFGPQLAAFVWTYLHNPALKWGSILGSVGTVVAGLIAGKSGKTNGESDKSPKLQILAIAGGVVFLLGGAVLASTLLYLLLFKLIASDEACYGCFFTTLDHLPYFSVFWFWLGTVGIGSLLSFCFEINIFGFNQFYRNRIVRCYLGATRTAPALRNPNRLTGFDFKDDIKLHKLYRDAKLDKLNGRFRGPFPIINCALNLSGSKDLTVKNRHSASFTLTPLHCGSDRPLVGYAPTSESSKRSFAGGIMLGQAVAVSGAAVSPNMGYNTSPLVAFMLTMFNVRLGWWFPNPSRRRWKRNGLDFSLYYLTRELLGLADERREYLNVSDGGHFENLAVYEFDSPALQGHHRLRFGVRRESCSLAALAT